MALRHVLPAVLAIVLSLPAAAFDRGDVLLENRTHEPTQSRTSYDLWVHVGWHYALAVGSPLIHKAVPYSGPGGFLIPAPNQIIFHHEQTISVWDGVPIRSSVVGKGYTDIFTADTPLSEIAPMRSGNYLVAERWSDRPRPAALIEFNVRGRLAEYRFPELIDPATDRALGAMHVELLSDQCTVLYTLGSDDPAGNRVRRLNICTNEPQTDFAALLPGEYAGAIRQLPNGDVLVANGAAVLQFTSKGSLLRTYQFPGVTHLALSTDGRTFWAAGVYLAQAYLRQFDPSTPSAAPSSIQLGNDEMYTLVVPLETTDLVVVGEWRVSTPLTRRGRAIRH